MALAGPQPSGGRPIREVVSRPRRKSSLRVVAQPPAALIALPSTPVVQRPSALQGFRSAWIVIAAIVVVVSYLGYRMIFGSAEQVTPDNAVIVPSEPAPGEPQVVPTPDARALGRGLRERDISTSIDAKTPAPAGVSDITVAFAATAPSITPDALKAVAPVIPIVAPAPRAATHPWASASKSRDTRIPRLPEKAARLALATEQAGVLTEAPASAPEPVVIAKITTPAARSASKAPVRLDHWQRMQVAERECQGEPFFGRLVCEQSVRNEYCAGQGGQMAECPGNPVN